MTRWKPATLPGSDGVLDGPVGGRGYSPAPSRKTKATKAESPFIGGGVAVRRACGRVIETSILDSFCQVGCPRDTPESPPPQRAPNASPARHQGPIWALVDHWTDRPAAANLSLAVDADRLRRMSSAWSSYPQRAGTEMAFPPKVSCPPLILSVRLQSKT